MPRNTLSDLNNHLFATLERLGDESLDAEQMKMEITNKFDYGITAGAGFELSTKAGRFLIEGRYYYGLSDIFKNSKKDTFGRSNNGTIVVKCSYLFDLKR